MATLVLVHGLNGGGWQYAKLRPLLIAAGHDVFTPTLTGLGERVHLAHPDTGLDTHVQDVVNVLEYEDLRRVFLVGWSYGGMVISGVADRVPDRLAHVIYGDAAVPRDGESLLNLFPPTMREQTLAEIRSSPDGWRIPWTRGFDGRYSPTLIRTLTQPVRLTNPEAGEVPRTFIYCTEGKRPDGDPSMLCARRAREAGWRYVELAARHLAPPRETAELLLKLTSDSR